MSPIKPKRNALIIKLWNKGKNNQEILTALKRAGYKDLVDTHSLSGVISRLKRTGKLPRERPGQELTKIEREGIEEGGGRFGEVVKFQVGKRTNKVISKQRDKSTSQLVYKRATFYLTLETIKQIKLLAVKRDKSISELVRETFTEYLSKQSDL